MPVARTRVVFFVAVWLLTVAYGQPHEIDLPRLVSRADIVLDRPVSRPEAGMPIGNGRMGSLVWTLPSALKLQINRVDVFGNDRTSNSFPQRYTDYAGGCAFVDIELVESRRRTCSPTKTPGNTWLLRRNPESRREGHQDQNDRLARAGRHGDRDHRRKAASRTLIRINLRMLRPAQFRTLGQTATSKLDGPERSADSHPGLRGRCVLLWFRGRRRRGLADPPTLRQTRDDELSLIVAPGNGVFTVFIASAASMKREEADRGFRLGST